MRKGNQKKGLLVVLKLLFLLNLSSCAVNIKQIDRPFCVEVNISKGFCTTPISGKEFWVDDYHLLEGKTWFEIRPMMILIPPTTWSEIKKFILNLCKRNAQICEKEIPTWERSTAIIDSQLNSKTE